MDAPDWLIGGGRANCGLGWTHDFAEPSPRDIDLGFFDAVDLIVRQGE